MREIKFRVWDSLNEKFWYIPDPNLYVGFTYGGFWLLLGISCSGNKFIIGSSNLHLTFQQYTEVDDKNGREIYEGDIVKIWIDGYECIAVIDWSPPCFWAVIHKAPEGSGIREGMASGFVSRHTKVIGNIYETPELLEEGNHEKV